MEYKNLFSFNFAKQHHSACYLLPANSFYFPKTKVVILYTQSIRLGYKHKNIFNFFACKTFSTQQLFVTKSVKWIFKIEQIASFTKLQSGIGVAQIGKEKKKLIEIGGGLKQILKQHKILTISFEYFWNLLFKSTWINQPQFTVSGKATISDLFPTVTQLLVVNNFMDRKTFIDENGVGLVGLVS